MSPEPQEQILQAFKEGKVEGLIEPGVEPTHIRTFISDVFLFPTTVYKIYRKDNQAFNQDFTDLSDPETRRHFYQEDFQWNNYFSPSIYKELMGVQVNEGRVSLMPEQEGLDRLIRMQRIDPTMNLTRLLLDGAFSEKDASSLGSQLAESIAGFPWRGPQRDPILSQLETFMRDVEAWASLADPILPRALTNEVMKQLRAYIHEHQQDFLALSDKDFVVGMDNHSDNVFFQEDKLSLIDIYPPKSDWRFVEWNYAIFRLSTDIRVLGGATQAEAFIKGCAKHPEVQNSFRSDTQWFYELYAALIRAPYLFLFSEKDPSRRVEAHLFKAFIEQSLR